MADASKYPTRLAPYGLRIPPDLKERLEVSARLAGRSLHSEIISALEYLYPPPSPLDPIDETLRKIIEDLEGAEGAESIGQVIGELHTLQIRLESVVEASAEKLIEERASAAKKAALKPIPDEDLPF